MLNMNSPTVQAMLGNTPQGFGNMPVYYGNQPSTTTQFIQQPSVAPQSTPFPSPKEMLASGGQQTVYQPTSFAPTNIVGAYNPGYQSAFAGYSNPYMGYGMYGGYGYQYYSQPIDEDSRNRLEAAINNGSTYDEQLEDDEKLFKTISRIVSRNIDRSEEDAEACENTFSIKNKYAQPENSRSARKPMVYIHAKITKGDEVLIESRSTEVDYYKREDYKRTSYQAEYMRARQESIEVSKILYRNQLYDTAPERAFDKTPMLEFFNNGVGVVLANDMIKDIREQSFKMMTEVYDRNNFRERLLANNGIKSKKKRTAIERFTGRYGVMPDGRPVSPSHDPSVAQSFSYDPSTGQYNITAPNFLQNRFEAARQSFIRSIDES